MSLRPRAVLFSFTSSPLHFSLLDLLQLSLSIILSVYLFSSYHYVNFLLFFSLSFYSHIHSRWLNNCTLLDVTTSSIFSTCCHIFPHYFSPHSHHPFSFVQWFLRWSLPTLASTGFLLISYWGSSRLLCSCRRITQTYILK